jgi:nucleoside-diphosphate-sugar epimerase
MPRSESNVRLLIVGGSGFLSGTLAHRAVARGYKVWTITRGQRPLPKGINSLIADRRDQAAFEGAVASANVKWDLVVDCIAFEPADVQQDIAVLQDRARHFVFVSTDFVYSSTGRQLPQTEATDRYTLGGYGRNKRLGETELIYGEGIGFPWTIVRPTHIYGPGSQLGCLPLHSRDPELIGRLKAGETLRLVGGGHFLQQPILARDLADLILALRANERTFGQVCNVAGPDIIESRRYYAIIAELLGVSLTIEEVPVYQVRIEHPEVEPFLCHRIYDLSRLEQCGVPLPGTPLEQGLREHVASLL